MTAGSSLSLRYLRVLPGAVALALVAVELVRGKGTAGAVLLALAGCFGAGLIFWARASDVTGRAVIARTSTAVLLACPPLLIVFFAFSSGGYFPDSVAFGALVVTLLLVARCAAAGFPLAGLGPRALVPATALAAFAGWILLSQTWSHAPGRATVEVDRALLYLLTFVLFSSIGRTRTRLAVAVRWCTLAFAFVAAIALLSRVAPDVLPTGASFSTSRLSFPLTYWNALGVFCAIGCVFALHVGSSDPQRIVRVLATAVLPVFAATLLLTFSRGGMVIAGLTIVVYAVLGRPRALVLTLLAAGPAAAVAMKVAYDATLLAGQDPTSAAAVTQGHHVGLVVVLAAAGAAVVRTLLLPLDERLERVTSPLHRRPGAARAAGAAAVLAVVVAGLALGAPARVSDGWDQFVHQRSVAAAPETRGRLASFSNQGRLALWNIALDSARADPLHGSGAGTFESLWFQHRQDSTVNAEGHSLYFETLGELGIVGALLIITVVLGILVGVAPLGRGRDRPIYAAVFAAGVGWAVHAGVDWDWEMPAVTLWFMALGGLALGRRPWEGPARDRSMPAFALGAAALVLAVVPALVLVSQVRLDKAVDAYGANDCALARRESVRALDVFGGRAGPWQIQALCSAKAHRYGAASADLQKALAKDPRSWNLRAALAATTAASGGDGLADALTAQRLNPRDPGVQGLARGLRSARSADRRSAAVAFLSQQSLAVSG
ncbi:MAG: hypothetical protein QOK49_318 [Baekduia sp.]|nr:hypothetical protein [Baekduia sp.]